MMENIEYLTSEVNQLNNEKSQLYDEINSMQVELLNKDLTIEELQNEMESKLDQVEELENFIEEQKTLSRDFKYSEQDLELLSKMINAEATGQTLDEKLAVGQVILNRKEKYGMTMEQTIYQRNESGVAVFSPIDDKRFWTAKLEQSSTDAAIQLLSGVKYSPVGEALYFCTHRSYNSGGWHSQYVNSGSGEIVLSSGVHIFIR